MGISNLWKIVSDAHQRKSLNQAAYDMRIDASLTGADRVIPILGVDISVCMDACIAGSIRQGIHSQSGSLQIFFNKLLLYAEVRATFVFVFDGPDRPAMKRDHAVQHDVWWTKIVMDLIQMFGFKVHEAPGEAEAELAMLNQIGAIDAVLSTDSDTLVFGASTILKAITTRPRSAFKKIANDEFEVYTREYIEKTCHLSQGGLLLFALLSGGDYNPGIANCGAIISMAMVKCGFGDELHAAANRCLLTTVDEDAFSRFIDDWRERMCNELASNTHGHLSCRRPDLANTIRSSDFPKRDILMAYISPVTSERDPLTISGSRFQSWHLFQEPSLAQIANFCRMHLHWNGNKLQKRLVQRVFPSIVVRMLYSPTTFYDSNTNILRGPTLHVTVNNVAWKKRKGYLHERLKGVRQPSFKVSVGTLLLLSGIKPMDESQNPVISFFALQYELPDGLRSISNNFDREG
ncbi:hypothetical protein CVT24_002933 [Panaeolus cyanescens]|uniref:XPG-I domain-containing protein n=1 Tax=Panaeolus cyanescens TaxID=181874 RepID=A0A409VP32_9AGAR|nr:hypothetical protein CVT24_002933 [Panaeolus cyanescens]